MRRLNQFILIIILVLGFLVGLQLVGGVRKVNADLADCICLVWDCYERVKIPTIKNPYPVGTQICECHSYNSLMDCTSQPCPYPSYVCNREDQCCDSGVVNPIDNDGTPNLDTNTCGNGICGSNETCDNCPADCNVCCGDGSCNYGESCLTCVADCGVCPDGPFCGDGVCDWDEFCNSCVLDCGFCPSCGDYDCDGFETCENCSFDCGACPANFAWWQVRGGNFATESDYDSYTIRSVIPDSAVCIEPNCYPYLSVTDRADTVNSDGFPLIAGGEISANGRISAREDQVSVANTTRTRLRETYSYFYNQYSLGLSPEDDYAGSDGDALKPAGSKDAYFHSGDLTIQSPWDVADGESFVIFVDGDLNIEDPFAIGELITVEEGGFLAFVVSGDINIADTVGHSVLTNNAANLEGMYVADGTLTTMSNGGMDKKFIGEGTFVGWTNVSMLRDFDEGADDQLYPTETFVYRPDFVKNTPEKMKRAQMLWQETN